MLDQILADNTLLPWLTFLVAFVIGYWIYVESKHQNLPPGPWGLPIIGYAPFLGSRPANKFVELSKKYGDIVRVKAFGTSIISLNSLETIRECYSTKGDQFSGRPQTTDDAFWFLTKGLGFIREEGTVWRDQRRFALHTLRDFGFGKLSLQDRVQHIGQDLISALHNAKGQPCDPMNMLANATFNVILYLTTDKHFRENDPDFIMIRKNIQTFFGVQSGIAVIIMGMVTKFLPIKWRPLIPTIIKIREEFSGFIKREIKEHEEKLEEDNPRDYIDAFLIERNKDIGAGRAKDTDFSEDRLVSNVLNLLVAGTETTSNTLNWALRLLSSRPEMQERLHEELDEVVGRERLPSILDRSNLPYTEAVILEVLRFSSIVTLSIPHSNPAPAKLKGYDIPLRSLVMGNIWAVHYDPEFWEEPEKFDPDRFMDPETKTKRRERVIPFSVGKRACLGESLARMELFLFLTMLLQKFTFHLPEGDTGDIKEVLSVVRKIEPYQLHAIPRD